MTHLDPVNRACACGDAFGLAFPASPAAFIAAGPDFLTAAFHAFGALPATNRVRAITCVEPCTGGSTGQKLFFSVVYETPQPTLHTAFFAKFSRDFDDVFRDRGRFEMASEIEFARLSRSRDFPIAVPVAYFADAECASGTALLITERIAFGTNGIEPHREKCLDHELDDPLAYYEVIVKALGRMAGAHKSHRLGSDIARRFPYDARAAAAANPIAHDQARLQSLVAQCRAFAVAHPQLLPANIATDPFFDRLQEDVARFREHETTVKRFLQSNPDMIALCHWNANIDNVFFIRDENDGLRCGLMDWGNVGQINLAFSLWGCLCGTVLKIWREDLDGLIAVFIAEIAAAGGPRLDAADLKLHLHMYMAMMGLFFFLDCPSRILSALPEAAGASGPLDPLFRRSERARNQLHMFSVLMDQWEKHDFGAKLDLVLQRD